MSRPTKDHVELLATVPLFSTIPRKHLKALATQFEVRMGEEGTVLTTQGEYGREFFAVVSGTARCEVDGAEVRTLAAGDFFGELALLAGGPRNATITVTSDMELLVCDRSDFTAMLRAAPEVAIKMLRDLAHRLQVADVRVTN